jgi:hypothetical protein
LSKKFTFSRVTAWVRGQADFNLFDPISHDRVAKDFFKSSFTSANPTASPQDHATEISEEPKIQLEVITG